MPAFVTDQFRILTTNNFVDSISNESDYYYIFVGLANPGVSGYGRNANWDNTEGVSANDAVLPNPVDKFDYLPHYGDTILYGKRIIPENIRRCVRKIEWKQGTTYDMYRHDYSVTNRTAVTDRSRLYDSNYYVMNDQFQIYICLSNNSSGINTGGTQSQDKPTFTDLEPSKAGSSGDGYLWKYLFTVPPSDIIKFDSVEFIPLPNDWATSTNTQISNIRSNADSDINKNQIKFVYIDERGSGGYTSGEVDIYGDGSGAKVFVETDTSGKILKTTVTAGGSGYTYGIVDLGPIQISDTYATPAKLIPIIPPSKGHGYDIYRELGADKVLAYSRFDGATKDFPLDTKFAQIGILKNPTKFISTESFIDSTFSGVYSLKVTLSDSSTSPTVGEKITQTVEGGVAQGYVASYDDETSVLKYFKDRSLFYNPTTFDQTDYVGVTTSASNTNLDFGGTNSINGSTGNFVASIDTTFNASNITVNNKLITLDSTFTSGVSEPEINKTSGDIIFIDNRPLVSRNSRQKEDVKIILEF